MYTERENPELAALRDKARVIFNDYFRLEGRYGLMQHELNAAAGRASAAEKAQRGREISAARTASAVRRAQPDIQEIRIVGLTKTIMAMTVREARVMYGALNTVLGLAAYDDNAYIRDVIKYETVEQAVKGSINALANQS